MRVCSLKYLGITLIYILLICFQGVAHALTPEEALSVLGDRKSSFESKNQAIEVIAQSNVSYGQLVLQSMSENSLFFDKKQGDLYSEINGEYFNVVTHEKFSGKNRNLKRVAINNSIRSNLTLLNAMRSLRDNSLSISERIQNANDLIGFVEYKKTDQLEMLRNQYITKSPELSEMLSYVIASADLDSDNSKVRNGAMHILSEFNSPKLIQKFSNIAQNDTDPSNRLYAEHLVRNLEATQRIYSGIETLYFGISLGSVLVLAAIGLSITFGVMGVINMAHGELMMIGAYTVYVMQQAMPNNPGIALVLSIPMAFIVSGLTGIIIERFVIKYLYGRPLETLLATFGISLLLQQGVRTIFSALNKNVVIPDFMSGTIKINEFLSITYNRFYIIIFCFLVFFVLRYILQHSRLGLEVRAVSQNRAMARNMGVRSARVNALTFGLGSGIAGLAGVALSQLTNVGPNLGQNYIVDSFLVVVFGGSGNIWGTMLAGMTLGIANKIIEPMYGAMLAKIIILVGVILFIQKRPRGLFPQRGRSVED
ncbi:MAG: urea ABC transporter permease subunit UrtB [Succinivibrionaceae bacterium]